ncbi:MAG: hypothetical protein IT454_12075 [Planctomycetes bacterium]|nr:hypothetical protein [Planctomycetota bacterium]
MSVQRGSWRARTPLFAPSLAPTDAIRLDVPAKGAFETEPLDTVPARSSQLGMQLICIELIKYHRIPRSR